MWGEGPAIIRICAKAAEKEYGPVGRKKFSPFLQEVMKKGRSGKPDNNVVLRKPVFLGDRLLEKRDEIGKFRP
jgi:hypothetical protein